MYSNKVLVRNKINLMTFIVCSVSGADCLREGAWSNGWGFICTLGFDLLKLFIVMYKKYHIENFFYTTTVIFTVLFMMFIRLTL